MQGSQGRGGQSKEIIKSAVVTFLEKTRRIPSLRLQSFQVSDFDFAVRLDAVHPGSTHPALVFRAFVSEMRREYLAQGSREAES